jgi:phosphatidate cytidylyltransferase
MKRIATSVVLVPCVLIALFRAPFWVFQIILALLAILSIREFCNLSESHGFVPFRTASYAVVAAMFLPIPPQFQWTLGMTVVYPFVVLLLGLGVLRSKPESFLPSVAVTFLGVVYIGLGINAVAVIRSFEFGATVLLIALVIIWTGDIFGYYVGKAIGKTPLAPAISPKKTWEGTAASLVASAAVGTALFLKFNELRQGLSTLHLLPSDSVFGGVTPVSDIQLWHALFTCAAMNVAAQLGDLAESAMKRGANAKDSGTLLPGHGGVLDRIDSLLLALPVLVFCLLSGFLRIHQK